MIAYYAVRAGRRPGVYLNWNDCKAQIDGFSGAVYKKFKTLSEAQAFMKGVQTRPDSDSGAGTSAAHMRTNMPRTKNAPGAAIIQPSSFTPAEALSDSDRAELAAIPDGACLAYVDGSFHSRTGIFGYGVVLMTTDGIRTFLGSGSDPELASMRNVSGEIHGAMRAVTEASRIGLRSITLFYDYMGIECWARGTWKTNKEGTRAYQAFMQKSGAHIAIRFQKVRAHTGVRFNEMADQLAKKAVGLL